MLSISQWHGSFVCFCVCEFVCLFDCLFAFLLACLFVCLFVFVCVIVSVCVVWDGDVRWMAMPEMWKLAKCGRKQTELPRALSYFSALTVQTGRFWKAMSNRH